MYVIVNSKKGKGKTLKHHILKDFVPRGFDARVEEIQEKHRQDIEQKDAVIPLLNNYLQNREYKKVALQAQRDVYQAQPQKCQDQIRDFIINRHVPRVNDPGKDKIVMIIEKTLPLKKMSLMSIPTTLQEYNDDLLAQKDDGLGHNIYIIE